MWSSQASKHIQKQAYLESQRGQGWGRGQGLCYGRLEPSHLIGPGQVQKAFVLSLMASPEQASLCGCTKQPPGLGAISLVSFPSLQKQDEGQPVSKTILMMLVEKQELAVKLTPERMYITAACISLARAGHLPGPLSGMGQLIGHW